MSSNVLNFTKHSIQNLMYPESGKRIYYRDAQVKGLVLDIRSSGTKSFYVYKKIKGRPERIYLGAFPDLTIENARRKALVTLSEIANGKNPQEEARAIRNENTFEQLFESYMSRYSKKHKKSWKYDEREINKFLSHWFKKKISDIRKVDVQRLLEKIYDENGLYQSNRMLERIRAMYNKAIEWGWEGTNPAAGIKKYKETQRDRFIQPAEMPCLIRSLEEEQNTTAKDYFWMLLLTGVRRTNTLMMRWEDISWERSEWRIPVTKNGDPVIVPLVDRAITILKERKATSNSPWVFPSLDDDATHLVNFKRAWKRTLQKATIYYWNLDDKFSQLIDEDDLDAKGYDEVNNVFHHLQKKAKAKKLSLPVGLMDLHIHDIRRTFGSYQAITGASLQIIGKSLGHKSPQSTQIYARLNLDPVRASIEKATQVMFG
jgi:integrase